jgi:hypothetical protein
LVPWKRRVERLIAFAQRYPGLIALFGFLSGVASFVLVERHEGLAKVIALVMLVSWVWLVLESLLRRLIARWFGVQMPAVLLRYLTQMVHQESLFFILPFYFVTTTWNSGQAIFSGLLAASALVAVIDPLYYRWLAPRRWVYLAFHTLTLFAVLLTALPIIVHLSTPQAYRWALLTAMVLSLPSLFSLLRVRRWWRGLVLCGLALALGAAGWLLRSWVPPATLWMTEMAATAELDSARRQPGVSLKQISAEQLRSGGLYAFTAISAPRGLKERIFHVWMHDGKQVDRIALDINGGRKAGYRAWTHKLQFPPKPEGRWQIRVVTEAGQMIGTLRFTVTP